MKIIDLNDDASGLRGAIVLHSTRLGPAFGGIRIANYPDADACQADAVRLAAAMTRKVTFHDIPGGGGKAAVMAGDIIDRPRALARIGEAVNALAGMFFTGPDSGFSRDDVELLTRATRYVSTEDVTVATARGVAQSIRAACDHAGITLSAAHAAVQGVGAIGLEVVRFLLGAGAGVVAADVDGAQAARARALGAQVIPAEQILSQPCDLLCPCALGGVIDHDFAGSLDCKIVVGAANNILVDDAVAHTLAARGIVFVPDFVSNGGGVIRGAWVHLRGTPGTDDEIDAIYGRTRSLLSGAQTRGDTPLAEAVRMVEGKLRGSDDQVS